MDIYLWDEELNTLLQIMDKDEDGVISYEEFHEVLYGANLKMSGIKKSPRKNFSSSNKK